MVPTIKATPLKSPTRLLRLTVSAGTEHDLSKWCPPPLDKPFGRLTPASSELHCLIHRRVALLLPVIKQIEITNLSFKQNSDLLMGK